MPPKASNNSAPVAVSATNRKLIKCMFDLTKLDADIFLRLVFSRSALYFTNWISELLGWKVQPLSKSSVYVDALIDIIGCDTKPTESSVKVDRKFVNDVAQNMQRQCESVGAGSGSLRLHKTLPQRWKVLGETLEALRAFLLGYHKIPTVSDEFFGTLFYGPPLVSDSKWCDCARTDGDWDATDEDIKEVAAFCRFVVGAALGWMHTQRPPALKEQTNLESLLNQAVSLILLPRAESPVYPTRVVHVFFSGWLDIDLLKEGRGCPPFNITTPCTFPIGNYYYERDIELANRIFNREREKRGWSEKAARRVLRMSYHPWLHISGKVRDLNPVDGSPEVFDKSFMMDIICGIRSEGRGFGNLRQVWDEVTTYFDDAVMPPQTMKTHNRRIDGEHKEKYAWGTVYGDELNSIVARQRRWGAIDPNWVDEVFPYHGVTLMADKALFYKGWVDKVKRDEGEVEEDTSKPRKGRPKKSAKAGPPPKGDAAAV